MITNEIKERLDNFFTMKSLVDGSSFKTTYGLIYLLIKKNDENYLMIHKKSKDTFSLEIIDEYSVNFLLNKYNYHSPVNGSNLDELVMFIEYYMMDA